MGNANKIYVYFYTERGIECCDIGGGTGAFALILAQRFPNSYFTNCDFSQAAIDQGRAEAARLGVNNLAFVYQDIGELPEEWLGKFDYVTMVDVLHDLPHPLSAVKSLYKMLKPDCYLSLLEPMCDSDPHLTVKNQGCGYPAPLLYYCSLYHCMSACLAYPGAAGLGPATGFQTITKLLNQGGFDNVQRTKLATDYHFICKP